MEYSHNFGSNFPNEIIPVGTKKDIDDTVKELINQYYLCIESGDLASANQLYEANKDTLESYQINMEYINKLEEEIYNTGIFALNSIKSIVSSDIPTSQSVDSFWYQDY